MIRDKTCRILLIACAVSLAFGAWPTPTARAAQSRAGLPPIFISEIAWAGSSRSTADEWLELTNASDGPITVSGWRLEGAGGDKAIGLPAGASVPARGALLIANYGVGDARSSLAVAPDVVTTTVSLSNDAQLIRLLDANGALVDQAGDGTGPFVGYSSGVKASMVRVDYSVMGDDAAAWATATTTANMSTVDLGTPKIPDASFAQSASDNPTTTPETSPASTSVDVTGSEVTDVADVSPPADTSPSSTVVSTEPEATATEDTTSSSTTDVTPTVEYEDASSSSSAFNPTPTTTTTTVENNGQETVEQPNAPLQSNATTNLTFVRLNEAMPNPADGKEWIEIVSAAPDRDIPLNGLELHDAVGRVMNVVGRLSPTSTFVVVELSSARFNNSGDSVYLKTSDGTVIDTLTYAESHEDCSWARDAQGAWRETTTPTKGASNVITASAQTTSAATSASGYEPTTNSTAKATTKTAIKKTAAKTSASVATTTSGAVKQSSAKKSTTSDKTGKAANATTSTKQTTKAAAAKTSTKKTVPIIKSSLDMLSDNDIGGLRVALEGTVGSPLRLVSGHAFVLLNQQGRGLMVRVPASQKLPSFGAAIRVSGTLKFDTRDLPYLSMAKDDGWSTLRQGLAAPQPKTDVLLEAPGAEDAWALVAASGTVASVSGKTIMLATDGADVAVRIRAGVAYRASRLKAGDTVSVVGLLDTSSDVPAILPRLSDELVIVAHAPEKTTASTAPAAPQSTLPGWVPFGAAVLGVGAIQGAKSVGQRLKKRKVTAKASAT